MTRIKLLIRWLWGLFLFAVLVCPAILAIATAMQLGPPELRESVFNGFFKAWTDAWKEGS